jgi:hypothetical protein
MRVRTARDIIEMVAILAAGIWAFYVFVYENRILPSLAQPNVSITATLQKHGVHNGLVAVELSTSIRNIGTVRAHFLGIVTVVYGQKIAAYASAQPAFQTRNDYRLAAFYHLSQRVPVYAIGYVTALGDPTTKADLPLEPGGESSTDDVFYVPAGRFDRLDVYVVAQYTRHDEKPIPTRIAWRTLGATRVPVLENRRTPDVFENSTYLATLDLDAS